MAAHTSPIIDEFKRLQREYDLTIIVVHHCIKSNERDKETTGSWLSGNGDLDSAWDFCLCLEWNSKLDHMHLRCFFRNSNREDIYYVSRKDENDRICGIVLTDDKEGDAKRKKVIESISRSPKVVPEIERETGFSESTIKRILRREEGKAVRKSGKKGNAPIWEAITLQSVQVVENVTFTPSGHSAVVQADQHGQSEVSMGQ
jgi:RecA-family ATPase